VILVIAFRQNIREVQSLLTDRDPWLARRPPGLQAIEMLVLGDQCY